MSEPTKHNRWNWKAILATAATVIIFTLLALLSLWFDSHNRVNTSSTADIRSSDIILLNNDIVEELPEGIMLQPTVVRQGDANAQLTETKRKARFRFGSRNPFVFIVTNVGDAKGVFKGRRKSTMTKGNQTVKQRPQGSVRLVLTPGESRTVRYRNFCHTNRGGRQRNSLTNVSDGYPIIGVVYVDGTMCP